MTLGLMKKKYIEAFTLITLVTFISFILVLLIIRIDETVDVNGYISAKEITRMNALCDIEIQSIEAEEGKVVSKGQLIATFNEESIYEEIQKYHSMVNDLEDKIFQTKESILNLRNEVFAKNKEIMRYNLEIMQQKAGGQQNKLETQVKIRDIETQINEIKEEIKQKKNIIPLRIREMEQDIEQQVLKLKDLELKHKLNVQLYNNGIISKQELNNLELEFENQKIEVSKLEKSLNIYKIENSSEKIKQLEDKCKKQEEYLYGLVLSERERVEADEEIKLLKYELDNIMLSSEEIEEQKNKYISEMTSRVELLEKNKEESVAYLNQLLEIYKDPKLYAVKDGIIVWNSELKKDKLNSKVLKKGNNIAGIIDIKDIFVEILIPENDFPFISNDAEVTIMINAYPYERFGTMGGKIKQLYNSPTSTDSKVFFKGEIAIDQYAEPMKLFPGMTTSNKIILEKNISLLEYMHDNIFSRSAK